ncbi:MAG TPA: DUF1569 domain-containing protein [Thermoanaerobaculia bacterium]|jgi:hypothetical protein
MHTLWNPADRAELLRRFEALSPDAKARWGRMRCEQMLEHMVEGMRLGLGEFPTRSIKTVARFWPLNVLFVYLLPWPHGAPGPREITNRDTTKRDWQSNLAELRRTYDDFARRTPGGAWPEHPLFGTMSGKAWGRLGWRHSDHHLRQFGG